jgi:hypothetical protein
VFLPCTTSLHSFVVVPLFRQPRRRAASGKGKLLL